MEQEQCRKNNYIQLETNTQVHIPVKHTHTYVSRKVLIFNNSMEKNKHTIFN